MGHRPQVDPLLPGADAGAALPVEQRAVGGRLAQGAFEAFPLFGIEGVDLPTHLQTLSRQGVTQHEMG